MNQYAICNAINKALSPQAFVRDTVKLVGHMNTVKGSSTEEGLTEYHSLYLSWI